MSDQHATPYLYLAITMALFGSAFTSSKVIVGEMPHGVAAALRFGGAAVVLVVMTLLRPGTGSFSWRDLRRAGAAGLIGVFAYNILFFWAISLAPAVDGSVVVPVLSPVLTTFFSLVTGREAATARRVGGLAIGVAGAIVFFAGIATTGFTGTRLLGDLLYVGCAACWAAYSITSKKVLTGMDPLRATTSAAGAGALGLVLAAAPQLPDTDWAAVSATGWANLVFLAIGPTALAYLFYYRALKAVSPVTATVTMFAVPVFGTAFSVALLGESFTAVQFAGAVITIAGALLAVTQKEKVAGVRSGVAA
ncbi:DMT family transporter [Lentzea sp. NPDC005914]|uniref:DMT family transporter n=1 Tax=Lentzea sp. NPDC005914 TaxID=3154572 RepID=UPI0033F4DA78